MKIKHTAIILLMIVVLSQTMVSTAQATQYSSELQLSDTFTWEMETNYDEQ